MPFLALLWPLARGFLGLLAPAANPMNWPAIAIIAAGVFVVGWWKGDAHGDRQCAAASLRAEIARMKLEAKVKDEAADQEAIDAAALLAENERKEKADAALIKELRNRPDKCLLGRDAGRV
jgi:hypothetical protein